jgi:hypothetical protein
MLVAGFTDMALGLAPTITLAITVLVLPSITVPGEKDELLWQDTVDYRFDSATKNVYNVRAEVSIFGLY